MLKVALYPVLLVAACLTAGVYGAIHNQISYTVSPDYFHALKFHQFAIPAEYHGRVGASMVGWYASWWMGFIVGVPVLFVGLIMPDAKTYVSRCLIAFVVVVATALLVGLAALALARMRTHGSEWEFWTPEEVGDPVAFARAGTMHNFSYLGGFLGIVTGSLYLVLERVRLAGRKPAGERSSR